MLAERLGECKPMFLSGEGVLGTWTPGAMRWTIFWNILKLTLDYGWITLGLCLDCAWIVLGLSLDHGWILELWLDHGWIMIGL